MVPGQTSSSPTPDADQLAAAIGRRIRDLRVQSGLSLGGLATASGLGKGTLSELERGQRNPTLDTLFSVSTALRIPLSRVLFGPDLPTSGTEALRPPAHGESVVAHLLDRWSDEQGFSEVYRITIDDRVQQSKPHLAGVVETLTVIGGAAEIGDASAPVTIGVAETHTFPGDIPHTYRGVGGVATGYLTMHYPGRPSAPRSR